MIRQHAIISPESSINDTKGHSLREACAPRKIKHESPQIAGVLDGIASTLVLSLVSGSIFVSPPNLIELRSRSDLELVCPGGRELGPSLV